MLHKHKSFMQSGWLILCMLITTISSIAQTQTVRGQVIDKVSEKPLPGASIRVPGTDLGSLADENGNFILKNVPVGRIVLQVTFNGYKPITIPELLVTTGKELVLEFGMEEMVKQMDEVVVKGFSKKGRAANEFAVASARSFRPEEVQRFAGGRNDPSKLVANYAGVAAGDDSRNDIVVRGNSPTGVLWRVEGLPVENPNHFGSLGTTGGPVPILNTNALKNSDFFTGAFPAEFGNATSAVFDISFRSGNTNRHEKTIQLNAFTGLEAMFEGPLSKKKKDASYLIGYRYSFVEIAQAIGLSLGTEAVPRYQDWVYNFDFGKGKLGRLSLYGFGGISQIDFKGKDTDSSDFYSRTDQDAVSRNNLLVFGAKHTIDLNSKSFIRTVISYNSVRDDFDQYQYPLPAPPHNNKWQIQQQRTSGSTFRTHSFWNVKSNARLSWRLGAMAELPTLQSTLFDREGKSSTDKFDTLRNFNGSASLLQAYWQGRYKVSDKFTLTGGLNAMYLSLNEDFLLAPRLSASYEFKPGTRLYLSYGLHGQIQPLPIYLSQATNPDGTINQTNRNLSFTRANHYILGVQKSLSNNWRVMVEAYYQSLTNAPVDKTSSGYSALNEGSGFGFSDRTNLVSKGTGFNYGVEFTVERFLSKGWYGLSTLSLFDSRYEGSDKVERNTTFNFGYVYNLLLGREWGVGKSKRNAITTDMRLSTLGGRWQTPVDLDASKAAGYEVLNESQFNGLQLDPYFRLDLKLGYRINSNSKKVSHTIYLDFQNVTNNQNVLAQRYNPQRQQVGTVYQIGFFPDVLYRINF